MGAIRSGGRILARQRPFFLEPGRDAPGTGRRDACPTGTALRVHSKRPITGWRGIKVWPVQRALRNGHAGGRTQTERSRRAGTTRKMKKSILLVGKDQPLWREW